MKQEQRFHDETGEDLIQAPLNMEIGRGSEVFQAGFFGIVQAMSVEGPTV
jgi:hypothetical protein